MTSDMTDKAASPVLSVREAIDASLGGGIVGWVQRMRADHGGIVSTMHTPTGVYSGCSCGEVGCNAALWLAHVDDMIAAYEAKVQDLARETGRISVLRERLNQSDWIVCAEALRYMDAESQ